ncbi:hypothetical protein [Aneurinibacillus thermoaerophilus]|jgi:hypothetical protein|uniref:hypothetical protein n=1 Tax=Aneurinibacillus thermoaerophilus TaxID=143495 RepID=UPI002E20F916|nr:hypothetical protein [Aneurinibacillus thermoaerophilus]
MGSEMFAVFLSNDEKSIESIVDITDEYNLRCESQEPESVADDMREELGASMLVTADTKEEAVRRVQSLFFCPEEMEDLPF